MDDIDLDFLCGEFDERIAESLKRSVNIALDYYIEFLEVADCNTAADLIEGDVFLGTKSLLPLELRPLCGDVLSLLVGLHPIDLDTCLGRYVEAEDKHRH